VRQHGLEGMGDIYLVPFNFSVVSAMKVSISGANAQCSVILPSKIDVKDITSTVAYPVRLSEAVYANNEIILSPIPSQTKSYSELRV